MSDPLAYDDRYLENVFGSDGVLSRKFSGYRPREGQIILTRAIDAAFTFGKHLIAEAPCGVGKSLASLVPASYHAATSRQKTVYVTAGINLQEQLIEKDLPLLKEILPWADKFTFGLLKGRGNFLCLDSFLDFEAKYMQPSLFGSGKMVDVPGVNSPEAKRHLPVLREWAQEAIQGKNDGDMSGLDFHPHHEAWGYFSTSGDECHGKSCRHAKDCFALKSQRAAHASDIIVTNYHLFYQNLAVYKETGLDLVLPGFDAVILDEAHKASSIAEDFFGFSVHADNFKWLARKLGRNDVLGKTIEANASRLFKDLTDLKRDNRRYHKRLKVPVVSPHIDQLVTSLNQAVAEFIDRMRRAKDEHDKSKEDKLRARAVTLRDNVLAGCSVVDPDSVFFLNEDDGGRLTMQSKLVNPADMLRRLLWAKTNNEREDEGKGIVIGPRVTVVAISATLASGKNDLSYASRSLGAFGETRLITESPFDWPRQAILVIPDTSTDGQRPMPGNPNDDEWKMEMAMSFIDIVSWAKGRTLGLFTSHNNLNYVANYLAKVKPADADGVPYLILKQGDAPRTKLIQEFRENVSSVLLGTDSFWTGVDVPGESLSCVIIDKLPFASPDDPVMDVITERNPDDWFHLFSLPRTIIALRQGFGRGVRSETDRCCIVCLDRRIDLKSYRNQVLKALPPVWKSTKVEDIKDWFNDDPFA